MDDEPRRKPISSKDVGKSCMAELPPGKIEQLRNRPEKTPAEKCKEQHELGEKLKNQITELSGIRKSENVDARLEKIDGALETLTNQSKPLRKALNSTLVSADAALMEIIARTTREALLEIGGSVAVDPVDCGKKVAQSLDRAMKSVKHTRPDKSDWCSEWVLSDDEDDTNERFNDIFGDADLAPSHRFGERFGFLHERHRELAVFSGATDLITKLTKEDDEEEGESSLILPAILPFNAEQEFVLQLVDVECVEKVKKVREKIEKLPKKPTVELVKVNDKASTVQSEEVSITRELHLVLSVFKKELKARKTDQIRYYEFVTNPKSFSRTVENMFYVSYLMRDRELFLHEVNGVPVLQRPKDMALATKLTTDCAIHGISSLSFEQWQLLAKPIKKSIIEPLE